MRHLLLGFSMNKMPHRTRAIQTLRKRDAAFIHAVTKNVICLSFYSYILRGGGVEADLCDPPPQYESK